ncbi:MAG TPA: lysophospholipid acyltransferase family protein [Treponemataceae bacterium]|nr:lysophospholipid acyltransferase family protein [Treponemataceae bacterium]HQL04807.1 lysophospholipid acyltransferase family protein [Treponemataceae bacterium]
MFRTIVCVIRFIVYLVFRNHQLNKAVKLDRQGKIAERDSLTNDIVRKWARFVVSLTKSDVEVRGEENIPQDTAVVLIGNHQSYLDIPVLMGYVNKPIAFIAKSEILKVPVLSKAMKLMQCTFLVRTDMRQSVKAMAEAVETIKKGYSMVIFPEGTRSKGGPVIDFKAGSFKLAYKSGVPILPVTIDGTFRLFEEKNKVQSGKVIITVHPPVPTANLTKEEQGLIPDKIRSIVLSALPV